MIKYLCDRCSALIEQSRARFALRVELFAAYDGLEIRSADELKQRDIRAEIAQLLSEMKGMDPKQLEREVYARYEFDLCKACRDELLQRFEAGRLP